MRIPNTKPIAESGSHSFSREQAEPFAIRQLQRDFQQQPARAQTETISRVLRLLHDEARRQQNQPSALARLARKVYGIRAEDL
jgi:hypothetical protein